MRPTAEDLILIRFIAEVKDTDLVPRGGPRYMFDRLVRLGILPTPAPTDLIIDVTRRARTACRTWLEENP